MNLPNKLSVLRLIMIPFFVAAFIVTFPGHSFVATGIFALAALTDLIDGKIARKYNMVTSLGNFLDTIADKILVLSALVLICVYSSSIDWKLTIGLTVGTLIILAREFFSAILRAIAAANDYILSADKLGKIKAALQMVAVVCLLPIFSLLEMGKDNVVAFDIFTILLVLGVSLFAIAVVFSILSAINYIVKNRALFVEKPYGATNDDEKIVDYEESSSEPQRDSDQND